MGEEAVNIPERSIDLWRQRLATHTTNDTYKGRALVKFPEDLRIYQRVIEASQPEVIVELGSWDGGSAVWFADQLRTFQYGGGHVVSIDINPVTPTHDHNVTFIQGDATDPHLFEMIGDIIGDRTCMVVEDSAHTYEITSAILSLYPRLVTPGQWLVVEDGVVDIEELRLPGWPRGVIPAIDEFLATPFGATFTQHHLDQYILTCHPGGWLQKD